MTQAALKNPIAVLMACIAVVVFASVVTPRLSVDTFPELTPPVLVIGTMAPGLGPKDVEKTLTWRIEKYVSATPGVDHVQSLSRNNLAIIFVWLKWGTDLNAAQGLVQQQVSFAMAAVPKTLGVLPPFVLQYDPSNAPVVQVAVSGAGLSGSQVVLQGRTLLADGDAVTAMSVEDTLRKTADNGATGPADSGAKTAERQP